MPSGSGRTPTSSCSTTTCDGGCRLPAGAPRSVGAAGLLFRPGAGPMALHPFCRGADGRSQPPGTLREPGWRLPANMGAQQRRALRRAKAWARALTSSRLAARGSGSRLCGARCRPVMGSGARGLGAAWCAGRKPASGDSHRFRRCAPDFRCLSPPPRRRPLRPPRLPLRPLRLTLWWNAWPSAAKSWSVSERGAFFVGFIPSSSASRLVSTMRQALYSSRARTSSRVMGGPLRIHCSIMATSLGEQAVASR